MPIRSINSSDKLAVSELYKKLYPDHLNAVDLSEESFNAKLISLCFEEDQLIKGFISGYFISVDTRKEGQIIDLFIDSKYRNQGIGRKLVEQIEKEFKVLGVNFIFVPTDFEDESENPIPFYQKLNYKIINSPWLVKKI